MDSKELLKAMQQFVDSMKPLQEAFTNFAVVANDLMCTSKSWRQYRYPKSKKKRIRKKWSKNINNWRFHEIHSAFKTKEGLLILSTRDYNRMIEKFNLTGHVGRAVQHINFNRPPSFETIKMVDKMVNIAYHTK